MVNYFTRVITTCTAVKINFSVQVLPEECVPDWAISNTALQQVHLTSLGIIEEEGRNMLQVDLAKKLAGRRFFVVGWCRRRSG